MESLGIFIPIVFVIERHVHPCGAIKSGRDKILRRIGAIPKLEAITAFAMGICGSFCVGNAIQHGPATELVFLLEAVGVRQALGLACRDEAEGGLGDEILLFGGDGSRATGTGA